MKDQQASSEDVMSYAKCIITKLLKSKDSSSKFPDRIRATLNTPRSSQRSTGVHRTILCGNYLGADHVIQLHAIAAWQLAKTLDWDDRDLLPTRVNRLAKPNDTGSEIIWVQWGSPTALDILQNKQEWCTPAFNFSSKKLQYPQSSEPYENEAPIHVELAK